MLARSGHIPPTSPACCPSEGQGDVNRRRETDSEQAEKSVDIHYEDQ